MKSLLRRTFNVTHKYILYKKENQAVNGFQYLRSACVCLCLLSIASPAYCQSEFVEKGQSAGGGSVGIAVARETVRNRGAQILAITAAATSRSLFDIGVTYSRLWRDRSKAESEVSIFGAFHFPLNKDSPGGAALFGSVDLEVEDYIIGFKLYGKIETSGNQSFVPAIELGFLGTKAPNPSSRRETNLAFGAGVSLVSGPSKGPLLIITPQISAVQDSPTFFGVSIGVLFITQNGSSR